MLHDDEAQVAEPIDRGSITPSAEEQETLLLLVGQLQSNGPEPLYHFIIFVIAVVPGLTFESLEIQCFGAADQTLQLHRAEQFEDISVTHSPEPLIEILELHSHALIEDMINDKVHIFMLIVLVDEDLTATFFELGDDVLAKDVLLDDEGLVEGGFEVGVVGGQDVLERGADL